jgi:hypothetical protein
MRVRDVNTNEGSTTETTTKREEQELATYKRDEQPRERARAEEATNNKDTRRWVYVPNFRHSLFPCASCHSLIHAPPRISPHHSYRHHTCLRACLLARSLALNMLRRSTSRTKKDDTELDKQIRKLDKSTSTLELSCVEEFPERLLALTKLRSLNVSRSSLVSIPPRISKLDRLETLILQRNRLQRLPEELGLLRNLVILDIGKNQLKYLPDQLNMPALRELMCEMNQLEALPKKLSGIPSLTKVCYKYRTTILLQP